MKKVCFLIGNLSNSGGTERVTTLIANHLITTAKYEISILSLVGGKQSFFELNPKISIYSLNDKKVSFKSNYLNTVLKIRNFVKYNKINSLIVVDTIACIFTIPALFGLKVNHVCWEHFNFNNNNGVKIRDLSRNLAARYCNYIVTLTEKDKGWWQKGLKKINAEIISIPNPAPFSSQKNISYKKKNIVLAVGRLTHIKGFDMLIESWAKVHKQQPKWKLMIVGEGEERANLTNLILKYNLTECVELMGSTNEISKYYNEAKIFCMSSRFEGFPMVLLEAQSFGLPTVSFDCDTGPSEIIEHGINGLLVKVGDIDELAKKILNLMHLNETEYQQMASSSCENSYKYSVELITEKWLRVI
ncbi:glycosyltransferase family 4 protein [Acinetobacter indicus]|uniref:glycosyltransferase family 4 protein n=1 Tax=Acinetobacter indicus TaxID=756892 RepID=UPI00148B48D0|nr:glycosyltransferase family 4 protein [Acinetobacter indicus]NOJ68859.1 glycosyltransferase family 4 protein [Acinetobacter indicus]